MRLANCLRYLGLGISVTVLTVCLTNIAPAPARQTAAPVSSLVAENSPQQLTQAGRNHYQAGQFAAAADLWEKAATGFANGGDPLNQAMVLSNLTLAYQQLGQLQPAQQSMATSLQLLGCSNSGLGCATSRPDHTKVLAQTLTTLGSLQLSQGQAEPAFETWQQAADLYHQIKDPAGVIRTQINQAQALRAAGLYRRSETLLQTISQTLDQQSDPAIKTTGLISYGDALRLMGRLQDSQTVLVQGLKLAEQQQSPTDIAAAYLSLGNTAQAQFRADRSTPPPSIEPALNHYQQAADRAPTPSLKVQAQLNQLSLLVSTQSWSKAEALAQQISPQLPQLPLSRSKVYAQIGYAKHLITIADQHSPAGYGRQCQGQIAYDRAPTPALWANDGIASDQPLLLASAKPLDPGATLVPTAQSFSPLALAAYTLAEALQHSQQMQDWQAQSFALGYLGHVYETAGRCAEALPLTRQALTLAQTHKALDVAYRWQWQTGRLYRNLATTEVPGDSPEILQNPAYQKAIAAYQATYNTLQGLRRDLAVGNADTQFNFQEQTQEPIYREFVDLLLRPSSVGQDNLVKARQVIESLQIAELENFLQEPCVASNPESIDRVTDAANSTTAALYPIILKDRVEVILKLPQQKDLIRYRYAISETQVKETVQQLHLKLQSDYEFETVKQEAKSVYDWLIAPARKQLDVAQINTLVFVPDSKLRNVPMAALYDGNQFLVENFATTIALNLELQNPKPLPKQLRVLAASLTDPPARFNYFAKLVNVNQELDAIAQAGIAVIPIRDEQFTIPAFNQKIGEYSFSIVHLATHGQFSSDPQKTFLLTASGTINVDDLGSLFRTRGLNRTDEIELLVLSACETASGDSRAALGIAGTTVRAGARSAIASLWSLDDESSVELMKQFYQQLGSGTVSRAEALRQAQLSLMKNEQYAYPRYWSPLILLGNWL
ncbi:MAG: CHAT domain-containing protein [Synechococcales bacterium]|nr:CHAT domain-containing protein [Synechococcales bacterium]